MKRILSLFLLLPILLLPLMGHQGQTTCNVVISTSALNIRTGPGEAYSSIGSVSDGQALTLIGRNMTSTWGRVEFIGEFGWLSLAPDFVEIDAGCSMESLPIMEVPPAPDGERDRGPETPTTAEPSAEPTALVEPATDTPEPETKVAQPEAAATLKPAEQSGQAEAPSPDETSETGQEPSRSLFTGAIIAGIALIILVAGGLAFVLKRRGQADIQGYETASIPSVTNMIPVIKEAEQEKENIRELPAALALAEMLGGDVLHVSSSNTIPSINEDKHSLCRLYLKAGGEADRYIAFESLLAEGGNSSYELAAKILRLCKLHSGDIRIGQYEDGRYAVKLSDYLLKPYYFSDDEWEEGEDEEEA